MSDTEQEIAEQMAPDEIEQAAEAEQEAEREREQEDGEHSQKVSDAPRSQKEIEALNRKLDAEAERHAKRVAEIMGDDFALLVPSPIDWTPGFIFGVDGMLPAPSQLEELDAILGRAAGPDLKAAKDAQACEACNAIGDVLTGSRKEGQVTKPCTSCGGTGWTPKLAEAQPPLVVTNIEAYTNGAVAQPNQFPVADRWGRPAGHPHYGLEPAFVGG
jgi:hypothetical protein